MNLYDGLNISAQYGKGEGVWVRRGRETKQEGHQINQSRASVLPENERAIVVRNIVLSSVFKKTTACRRKTSWKSFFFTRSVFYTTDDDVFRIYFKGILELF